MTLAKLSIELVENQFALYDIHATLDGKPVFEGENYTSEDAALREARRMAWLEWSVR